jgi:hypothetical protein
MFQIVNLLLFIECTTSDYRLVTHCNGSKYVVTDSLKDWLGEPDRGSEWEPIKILLEGDENSNKMNTDSKTRLRLNYPS